MIACTPCVAHSEVGARVDDDLVGVLPEHRIIPGYQKNFARETNTPRARTLCAPIAVALGREIVRPPHGSGFIWEGVKDAFCHLAGLEVEGLRGVVPEVRRDGRDTPPGRVARGSGSPTTRRRVPSSREGKPFPGAA